MRKQSSQVAQAVVEQSRALRDMSGGAENVSKQIAAITRSNREHTVAAEDILKGLVEVRSIAEGNARGAQESQTATENLRESMQALGAIADRMNQNGAKPPRRR